MEEAWRGDLEAWLAPVYWGPAPQDEGSDVPGVYCRVDRPR